MYVALSEGQKVVNICVCLYFPYHNVFIEKWKTGYEKSYVMSAEVWQMLVEETAPHMLTTFWPSESATYNVA